MKIQRLRTSRKRGTFAFRGVAEIRPIGKSRRPRTLFHPCPLTRGSALRILATSDRRLQDCGCSPPGDFRWELLPLRLWTLTSGLGGRVESLHLLLRIISAATERNNINYIRTRPRARGHGALRVREGQMPSYTPRTIHT
ncbi:hypothetical protein ASPBRDRAFT_51858 [Aspergillus brasiliensis CBS 101740]|uniref:Uncharacterized protein n=1 Tax=Aspergillus brasiliensis (strain CBS 101740 / IMI 381727 / IBT 21946) TaxID=767769 RepID=A0A1L9UWW7_ASPBC|nr:hypothetical protein ASPBRDRAFT_51858 [Aspergillus brasiliensis CBS 101740]